MGKFGMAGKSKEESDEEQKRHGKKMTENEYGLRGVGCIRREI